MALAAMTWLNHQPVTALPPRDPDVVYVLASLGYYGSSSSGDHHINRETAPVGAGNGCVQPAAVGSACNIISVAGCSTMTRALSCPSPRHTLLRVEELELYPVL